MIVLVAGLGRCGSSMVMQMLEAGGMKLTGDAKSPFCEDRRVKEKGWPWLIECCGGELDYAIKTLIADDIPPPRGPKYKAIWLDRDPKQQSLSWFQFEEWKSGYAYGSRYDRSKAKGHGKRQNKKRRLKAIKALQRAGASVLPMSFEAILSDPLGAAGLMRFYLDRDLDTIAMAGVVRERSPDVTPGGVPYEFKDFSKHGFKEVLG